MNNYLRIPEKRIVVIVVRKFVADILIYFKLLLKSIPLAQ